MCSLMKLQQIKSLLTSKTQNIFLLFWDVFELYGFFNPFSLVVSPLNWNFVSPPSLSVIIERSISSVAYLINELPFVRCLLLRSRSVHDPSQKTNKKFKFLLAREAAEKMSLRAMKNVIKAASHAISFFVFTRFCVFFSCLISYRFLPSPLSRRYSVFVPQSRRHKDIKRRIFRWAWRKCMKIFWLQSISTSWNINFLLRKTFPKNQSKMLP